MKIGIIGAGHIGGTLGRAWDAAGHDVRFGVRNADDDKFDDLRRTGVVGTVAEAVAFGEVVLLALPGAAVGAFASEHADALAGKVIVDATNYVGRAEMSSLPLLAERIPGARLVRAFSTLGWENFAEPQIGGVQVDLFFCASPGARAMAEELIADAGLCPVYVGDVDVAPALDGLTRIWFSLAFGQGYGRRIAFKLLVES